ncbi:MAG: hypothetical protein P8J18_01775 [Halieaceae bacterium]|nr:hypothetical protein [Halieaceae bacterium]
MLFVDDAYFLYRPENERDYGKEAIEILLKAMEDHRDDFVVILAGYEKEMGKFFSANPGMGSRVAHHIDFPDYNDEELIQIVDRMLVTMQYQMSEGAKEALGEYISLRRQRPSFSNARSIRNALDRCRLRQAK